MRNAVRGAFQNGVGSVLLWVACVASHRVEGAVTFSVSPTSVSNWYTGSITLQVAGLTNGETVLVEKYIDLNTNSVIDSGDWLVQSLKLTDGQQSIVAGVTNINVPGDTNATGGTITARVNFQGGGFVQQIAARYAYKLSSPSGRFAAITNFFTVTNLAYAQSFTGTTRNSGTNVPYAPVILFTPPTPNGGMNPIAGTVANGVGGYTLKAPPGTYLIWGIRRGYVANLNTSPTLTLNAGATITTNLTLTLAPRTVSGKLVDAANNSVGLAGVSIFGQSTNNTIAVGYSDSSGNFSIFVTSNQWKFDTDSQPLAQHGYVSLEDGPQVNTTTGNVSGLTVQFPKGTSLIYGSVKDNLNQPLPAVRVHADENNGGSYRGDAVTDQSGNYAMAVIAGMWNVSPGNDSQTSASYVFSQTQGSTNITDGVAVRMDFIGILGTNQISGHVRDNNGNAITNVGIYASASLNGSYFSQYGQTDGTGYYAFKVPNGNWEVGVNCNGGNNGLNQLGYLCVDNQAAAISNNNAVVDFTALKTTSQITGAVLDGSSNPVPNADMFANGNINGTNYYVNGVTDGTGHYVLNVANGTWDVGVSCYGGPGGGGLSDLGYLCVNNQTVVVSNSTGVANFTVIATPYQISGFVRDTGGHAITNVGVNASATIGGTMYNVNGATDGTGHYVLNVANGTWDVNVNCYGGMGNDLSSQGYLCVNSQSVVIINGNGAANFAAQPAPYQIVGSLQDSGGRPLTNINVNANATINGTMYWVSAMTDVNGLYALRVANGTWNVNVDCNALGQLGVLCVNNQNVVISNANGVANFVAPVAPWQITGLLTDTGGNPITNISIYANVGTNYNANGMTDATGHYVLHVINGSWTVWVNCSGYNGLNSAGYLCLNGQAVNIANNNGVANFIAPLAPFHISGFVRGPGNAPVTNVNVYANSGPYNANSSTDNTGFYSLNVANGNWDVNVDCFGLNNMGYACPSDQMTNISGANAVVNFTVQPFNNPQQPLLISPTWLGPGGFQFTMNTVAGVSYTAQYSTTLSNWFPFLPFVGNGLPKVISDPGAAGSPGRYYRVKVGP